MSSWKLVIASLLLNIFLVDALQNFDWTYAGKTAPNAWKNNYPACGGSHQSPINIVKKKVNYDPNLKPFVIALNKSTESSYTIKNLGLNAEIFFEASQWGASIAGYPEYCYRIAQMHFHWGSDDMKGSEHTVDGHQYPIEAHFVMWNCKMYKTFEQAAGGVNGLAVLGVFFKVDNSVVNPVLTKITDALSDPSIRQCPCKTPADIAKKTIKHYDVTALLPKSLNHFYRYGGSLTTPPCTENVLWTVFKDPMTITQSQLEIFRALRNRNKSNGGVSAMVNNFRPVAPLNAAIPINSERAVTASFRPISVGEATKPTMLSVIFSTLALVTYLQF